MTVLLVIRLAPTRGVVAHRDGAVQVDRLGVGGRPLTGDVATPPPSGTPTGDTSSTDGGSPASSPPVGQADGSGSFNEASPSAGPPAALAATPDPHPSDPVPATEAAAPAVTESLAGGIGASPGALLPVDLSAASHGGAPWARLFALVPLCAAVGVGSAYGRRYVLARG